MKLSTRGRYGLRAVLDLALHHTEGPVPLREVAARQSLSENYLEQLVGALRRAKLVNSVRGPTGGYYLARDPSSITLGEIIRVLEGPIAPVECGSGRERCGTFSEDCFVHNLWQDLSSQVNEIFDRKTLAEILEEAKSFHRISGCFKEGK